MTLQFFLFFFFFIPLKLHKSIVGYVAREVHVKRRVDETEILNILVHVPHDGWKGEWERHY